MATARDIVQFRLMVIAGNKLICTYCICAQQTNHNLPPILASINMTKCTHRSSKYPL